MLIVLGKSVVETLRAKADDSTTKVTKKSAVVVKKAEPVKDAKVKKVVAQSAKKAEATPKVAPTKKAEATPKVAPTKKAETKPTTKAQPTKKPAASKAQAKK